MDRIDRQPIIQARVAQVAERLCALGCSERQAALHAEQLFKARIAVRKRPESVGRDGAAGNVRPGRKWK